MDTAQKKCEGYNKCHVYQLMGDVYLMRNAYVCKDESSTSAQKFLWGAILA